MKDEFAAEIPVPKGLTNQKSSVFKYPDNIRNIIKRTSSVENTTFCSCFIYNIIYDVPFTLSKNSFLKNIKLTI